MTCRVFLTLIISLCVAAPLVHAQRAGQSISVQYGVVTGGKQLDLNSGAVPRGAVVGGALGLASARGKKSSKKTRNALIGAAAGSALSGAAQGDTRGMVYNVALTGSAGEMQVVTDVTIDGSREGAGEDALTAVSQTLSRYNRRLF